MDSHIIRVALLTENEALFGAEAGVDFNVEVLTLCENFAEELQTILASEPDVIILDADLPDGQVLNLADVIRNHVPSTKIIFLTGIDTKRWVHQAIHLQLGGNNFELSKCQLFEASSLISSGLSLISDLAPYQEVE